MLSTVCACSGVGASCMRSCVFGLWGTVRVQSWPCACTGLFFAPDPNAGAIAAACKQSWYSLGAAESHTTEWQSASSPEDDCAKIVIVQAAGPTDTYRTTEVGILRSACTPHPCRFHSAGHHQHGVQAQKTCD